MSCSGAERASKPAAGACITTQLACRPSGAAGAHADGRLVCCFACQAGSICAARPVPLYISPYLCLYITTACTSAPWHGMPLVVRYMPHVLAHAGSAPTCTAAVCTAWHGGDLVSGPRPQCSCMCMVEVEGLGTDVCPEIACSPLPAFSVWWVGLDEGHQCYTVGGA